MLRIIIFLLVVFGAFLSLQFNESLAWYFNEPRAPLIKSVMIFITNPGVVIASALLALALWRSHKLSFFAIACLSAAGSIAIAALLKEIYQIPRPYLLWDITPGSIAHGKYGLPSMHATFMFALLPIVEKAWPKKLPMLAWLSATLLIAFSRLYLGVHTLSDLLFGAAVGYLAGYLVYSFNAQYQFIQRLFQLVKNHLEFRRQIAHILIGSALIFLIDTETITVTHLAIIMILGAGLSLLAKNYRIPLISLLLDYFERDQKKRSFPGQGAFFLVLGSLLTLVIFPKDIALAAIAIMTVGDAITNIIGTFYGSRKNPFNAKKNLEGTLAAILLSTAAAWLFIPLWPAFLASTISMLIESIDLKILNHELDDNLLIPIIAAIVAQIAI